MKRFVTLVALITGIGAASAVAAAHAGSTDSSTGTTSTSTSTTSTTSTTTTTPTVSVVKKFPAAGLMKANINALVVRRQPSPHASKEKVLPYFMPDYRPQEIFAFGAKMGTDGQPWYHISVPGRPNGQTGWIPAAIVDLAPTTSQIVVHVGARTIDVYRRGKHMLHAIVAVGKPGTETPLGHYYVQVRYYPVGDPFLGVWALETSAYSKLSDWPGGGIVGIHGTNEPWLLGQAVSHGCVRVSNATASALKRLAPLGTPITIKA